MGVRWWFFLIGLLKAARNTDEVAFVLGHEMAHHIAGHIQQRRGSAGLGGLILGGLIAYSGGSVRMLILHLTLVRPWGRAFIQRITNYRQMKLGR